MRIQEIKIYTVSELSPKAFKKAHADFTQKHIFDFSSVDEDFRRVLNFCGFRHIRPVWSGFCSQGDGASFAAAFTPADIKAGDLAEYFRDDELNRIAAELQKIPARDEYYHVERSGRYSHKYTMGCENEDLLELSRDLADWYYSALKAENDYMYSEEYFREMADCNDWEFTEDGEYWKN